jgi:hypothetical protein
MYSSPVDLVRRLKKALKPAKVTQRYAGARACAAGYVSAIGASDRRCAEQMGPVLAWSTSSRG